MIEISLGKYLWLLIKFHGRYINLSLDKNISEDLLYCRNLVEGGELSHEKRNHNNKYTCL